VPYVSKGTFRTHELRLLQAVESVSDENMKTAAEEVRDFKEENTCGISVDGTLKRRRYMSLNGCVSAISINTGKILDVEMMTQYC